MKTHLKPELLSSGLPHSGCLKACPTPGSALMTSVKIRATALMLSPCTQWLLKKSYGFNSGLHCSPHPPGHPTSWRVWAEYFATC